MSKHGCHLLIPPSEATTPQRIAHIVPLCQIQLSLGLRFGALAGDAHLHSLPISSAINLQVESRYFDSYTYPTSTSNSTHLPHTHPCGNCQCVFTGSECCSAVSGANVQPWLISRVVPVDVIINEAAFKSSPLSALKLCCVTSHKSSAARSLLRPSTAHWNTSSSSGHENW